MLDAAVVGSARTVDAGLRDVGRRWAPDEVMAMTDLPDLDATTSSDVRLAEVTAVLAEADGVRPATLS